MPCSSVTNRNLCNALQRAVDSWEQYSIRARESRRRGRPRLRFSTLMQACRRSRTSPSSARLGGDVSRARPETAGGGVFGSPLSCCARRSVGECALRSRSPLHGRGAPGWRLVNRRRSALAGGSAGCGGGGGERPRRSGRHPRPRPGPNPGASSRRPGLTRQRRQGRCALAGDGTVTCEALG